MPVFEKNISLYSLLNVVQRMLYTETYTNYYHFVLFILFLEFLLRCVNFETLIFTQIYEYN